MVAADLKIAAPKIDPCIFLQIYHAALIWDDMAAVRSDNLFAKIVEVQILEKAELTI